MNDLTTALAMEIVLFSISVFVKMAFTGSTVHLVNIIMQQDCCKINSLKLNDVY